jgi:hypothetical protein
MDLLRRHMASLRQAIESGFVYRLSETIINPIEDDVRLGLSFFDFQIIVLRDKPDA